MKVSVIILNWNDHERTRRCALSVQHSLKKLDKDSSASITIVDNGSRPSLITLAPDINESGAVEIITSEENLGYAGGMNQALTPTRLRDVDAVWLLNNDTLVDENALKELIAYKRNNPNKLCIGSIIINSNTGKIETVGGYRYLTSLGLARPIGKGFAVDDVSDQEPKLDYISGAALFLDAPWLLREGGVPAENFLYYEELNLADRFGGGSHLGTCLNARVTHDGGGSTAKLKSHLPTYYSTLAALRYTKTKLAIALPLVYFLRVTVALGRDITGWSSHNLKGVLLAAKHFSWH